MAFTAGNVLTAAQLNTFSPSGSILNANGSAAAPAYAFTSDSNTGIYNVTGDSIGIATAGTLRRTISDTIETTTLPQRAASAAASAPAYSFTDDPDTGIYLNGEGNLGSATAPAEQLLPHPRRSR